MEVSLKPGEKVGTHSHPDHVVFLLTDAKLKETIADGKTNEITGKAGEAKWMKAVTHSTENAGTTPLRGIVVELKEPVSSPSAATPADKDPVKLAADSVKVLFENDRIRVIQGKSKAGGKVAMHAHPDSVSYAVSDVKVKSTTPDGKATEKAWKAGEVAWHDAWSHAVENIGTTEGSLVTFELKEPAAKAPGK
jgi:quercetin dioxygenase-like cupin family protein